MIQIGSPPSPSWRVRRWAGSRKRRSSKAAGGSFTVGFSSSADRLSRPLGPFFVGDRPPCRFPRYLRGGLTAAAARSGSRRRNAGLGDPVMAMVTNRTATGYANIRHALLVHSGVEARRSVTCAGPAAHAACSPRPGHSAASSLKRPLGLVCTAVTLAPARLSSSKRD